MSEIPYTIADTPLLRTGCRLGEGPIYDNKTGILHFVDIVEKRVYHYDTQTQDLSFDQFEEPITALAIRANGKGLACAAAAGFALINTDSDHGPTLSYLARPLSPSKEPFTRFNDGACDVKGRFLAGTIESKSPDNRFGGSLYRYDPSDQTCVLLDDQDITDSNGLGWSADNKTLYFTNSLVNHIYAYDYNVETGAAENRRIFVDATSFGYHKPTYCDGFCIDSEGCIWSARWAGSKIVRFNREGTAVIFEVRFPTAYSITACCFGGPDLDKLYVTTAHPEAIEPSLDSQLAEEYPDSGHIFMVDFRGQFSGGNWRYEFGG